MATNEIVEKLNRLIEKANVFTSEANVVYFFVQLRKLMDREGVLDEYRRVKFYCDWIVHPAKNQGHSVMADIYEAIYQECTGYYNGTTEADGSILVLMRFDALRQDIAPLLDNYGLPSQDILVSLWPQLTKSLVSILSDQPLARPSEKISEIVIDKQGDMYKVKVMFTDPFIDNRGYNHNSYIQMIKYSSRDN